MNVTQINVRNRSRRGVSVLTVVLLFSMCVGVMVLGYQNLRGGAARTMFAVHEHRQVLNIARSALSEARFNLQTRLNRRDPVMFYWFAWRRNAPDHTFAPVKTRASAEAMIPGHIPGQPNTGNLDYECSDVKIIRQRGFPPGRELSSRGIVDLEVTVKVTRKNPKHEAELTLVERRYFELLSPDGSGARVRLSPTPITTAVKDEIAEGGS